MVSEQSELDELSRVIGRRLAEIRREAGLTQAQLAARLHRTNRGWQQAVSRFERGEAGRQSLFFIFDYLRACGKGIGAVTDVLDEYTSRPLVIEQQARRAVLAATAGLEPVQRDRAQNYDIGLRHKARQRIRTAQDIERRVRQVVKRGKAEAWERRLRRAFNEVLHNLHVRSSEPMAIHLASYGRKVFAALRRTRKARPVWRDKAMAKLDLWAKEHELAPEPFARMKRAVTALMVDMERRGELD